MNQKRKFEISKKNFKSLETFTHTHRIVEMDKTNTANFLIDVESFLGEIENFEISELFIDSQNDR